MGEGARYKTDACVGCSACIGNRLGKIILVGKSGKSDFVESKRTLLY